MSKVKPILLLSVTLIIGIFLGILASRMYFSYRLNSFQKNERGELRQRILKGIELSEEQESLVDPIFERHIQQMQATRTQFRKNIDALHIALDSILTEEQREAIQKRREKARQRWRDGKGPPPFGGKKPGKKPPHRE